MSGGVSSLDGEQLYQAFSPGLVGVQRKRDYLNRINVVPVPDGDTGTNIAAAVAVAAAGGERRLRRLVGVDMDARLLTVTDSIAQAVVISALLPAVAATAAASARVDRPAGLLYAPYLAWSTYASALNLEIWRRNRSY